MEFLLGCPNSPVLEAEIQARRSWQVRWACRV